MRIEEFHSLLDAGEIAPVDIHEMKSLLDRHPYSHVVRLAYLKSLHAIGDDRLGHALDEAAVHLPDRKVLYSYMEQLAEVEEAVVEEAGDPAKMNHEAETAIKDDPSKVLQRQYLTEAVQSSILMEVGEEDSDEKVEGPGPEGVEVAGPPTSFLDFIAGESSIRDVLVQNNTFEVISRFLSNEKRDKTEFFDSGRMAKKSLDDSGGLVTDTLARIYINQGNLDKALEAYQQLILKYPEKSGYFAARIQKVEELKRKKKTSK